MRAILFTGGVGDIIAIESLMADHERNSIECIFYATRAATPCIELFTNVPTFPKLKKQLLLWKNFNNLFAFNSKEHLLDKLCAYQPDDLQRTVRKLTEHLEDWSISKIFEQTRGFTYSSFINNSLANINRFNLPENYYCICPYTNNDKRDSRRDYSDSDWNETLNILRNRNMAGVIINNGNDPMPTHKSLINLNNKTTIREAVEIVKSAKGYVGIDSAFSVIASKLFKPQNIIIKSVNEHCYKFAHIYFAPYINFEFLKKTIKAH